MMTLRKLQGFGTLTVPLSCKYMYVHGFKRPSMFILDAHLNCASKSCVDKSCYEEASVFSLLNMVPRYGIDDTIQYDTLVYI